MPRHSRVLVSVAGVVALALIGTAGQSSAAPASVPSAAPRIAAADSTPDTPDPSAVVTFLVGLRHPIKELRTAAQQASSPGTRAFRSYLTVREAAARYGASVAAEHALVQAAHKAGLVAKVDGTRLFARVSGTVSTWQNVMGQPIQYAPAIAGSAQDPGAAPFEQYGFGDAGLESLAGPPQALKSSITWFLPTYMHYVASLDVPGPPRRASRILIYPGVGDSDAPRNQASPLGPSCLTPQQAPYVYTPWQLSHAYGLAPLQKGAKTEQPRIAVLSLGGGFAQSDVNLAAACFGHRAPTVDLRTGIGIDQPIVSLSLESALDLQTVSWAAKNLARVRFVQVINNVPGFIEAYALALTGWATPPDAITNSWGGCELGTDSSFGSVEAVESLFQMSAVVGTSVFSASGDRGSSACQTTGEAPDDPRPTVQYPGSSPFMTAVGGTQLNLGQGNKRIGESVWNDLQYGAVGNAVGTGGPSVVFTAPWYQRPVGGVGVRSVPDIAAQAGIGPGTAIYAGGQLLGPTGGTSQASPLVAAGFAEISARLRAHGRPGLGFINPWIYLTARQHPDSVYDVTIGDNQYPVLYAQDSLNIPACCQAGPGFDAASGLGAPLFGTLLKYVDPGRRG